MGPMRPSVDSCRTCTSGDVQRKCCPSRQNQEPRSRVGRQFCGTCYKVRAASASRSAQLIIVPCLSLCILHASQIPSSPIGTVIFSVVRSCWYSTAEAGLWFERTHNLQYFTAIGKPKYAGRPVFWALEASASLDRFRGNGFISYSNSSICSGTAYPISNDCSQS